MKNNNIAKIKAPVIIHFLIINISIVFFQCCKEEVFENNDSFWANEQPDVNSELKNNINVDIAIIGGGYTGLSAAWHLAKTNPNLKIVLFEARKVGSGGSGRNGGMILPQSGLEQMAIVDDAETHKKTYDITVESMHQLKNLIELTGVDCDLVLNGYCECIYYEEDVAYYKEYVAKAQNMGMPLEFWDRAKTKEKLGTDIYYGAVYDPNGGSVHAMKLVKALKKAVENEGVTIYENSPVVSIKEGSQIQLKVGNNKKIVNANAIVLATNGYTSKLGFFKNRIMPMHAQCAATYPLTDDQLAAMNLKSRLPFYDSRNMLYHLVLTPDNRIIFGGGNANYFFNNGLHYQGNLARVADMMLEELIRMYPKLKGIQFEYVWNGILGMTYDEVETVGVTGKHGNIYYALAYNGHGVNSSFLFGDIVAHIYNDQEHPWAETAYYDYPLSRIPPEPFKFIGVNTLMKFYRWQDNR